METPIFFEDLGDEAQSRIRLALLYELEQEIEEAVANGTPRDTAEVEIVNDYINRNNIGCAFSL